MQKRISFVLRVSLIWLTLSIGWSVSAQENNLCRSDLAREITYGDTVAGVIDDDLTFGWAFYCFEAARGDNVTVTVTAEDGLQPIAILTDPILDPNAQTLPPPIGDTVVSADGLRVTVQASFDDTRTVLIVVQGNQNTQGNYVLSLTAEGRSLFEGDEAEADTSPEPDPDAVNFCDMPTTSVLSYGDVVTGVITDVAPFSAYCFEGNAGDVVTVEAMTLTDDLVAGVIVATPDFTNAFAEVINNRRTQRAQAIVTLPEDGTYLAIVTRQGIDQGNSSGEYELQLLVDADPVPAVDCTNATIRDLNGSVWVVPGVEADEPVMEMTVSCLGIFSQVTAMSGGRLSELFVNRAGDVMLPADDGRYTTVSLDEDRWVLETDAGFTIALDRRTDEICQQGPVAALIDGTWVLDIENVLIIDFTCGDVAYLVENNQIQRINYLFEPAAGTLTLNTQNGSVVFEDVTIDGTTLSVTAQGNPLTFENSLGQGE